MESVSASASGWRVLEVGVEAARGRRRGRRWRGRIAGVYTEYVLWWWDDG